MPRAEEKTQRTVSPAHGARLRKRVADAADRTARAEAALNFGEELRRARELRQISLREVSEATKINLRYLQAMEANQFDELPGGVFNRGFVRAYSQFVGIDPDAMVDAYVVQERVGDIPSRGANEAYRRGADLDASVGRSILPWVVAAVFVLTTIAIWIWLRTVR